MSDRQTESEWSRTLASLPREIAPRRDPWPEIAARIAPAPAGVSERRNARAWQPLAAAAVVVVAAGLLLRLDVDWGPAEATAQRRAPGHAESLFAAAEEYRAMQREFAILGEAGLPGGAPVGDYLMPGWAVLAGAEVELAAALSRAPDDPFIQEQLVRLRARQIELLRLMASLSMS